MPELVVQFAPLEKGALNVMLLSSDSSKVLLYSVIGVLWKSSGNDLVR